MIEDKVDEPKILERIRKLMALSKSANIHEAATAAAMSQRLMQEHKLTEADVSNEEGGTKEWHEIPLGAKGFMSVWRFKLVTSVSRAFFCEAVGLRVGKRRKVRMVGRKEDAALAVYMFGYLETEIERLVRQETRDPMLIVELGEVGLRSYANAFRYGAVLAISERLVKETKMFVRRNEHTLSLVRTERENLHTYLRSRFTNMRFEPASRPSEKGPAFMPQKRRNTEFDELALMRGYVMAQNIPLQTETAKSAVRESSKNDENKAESKKTK